MILTTGDSIFLVIFILTLVIVMSVVWYFVGKNDGIAEYKQYIKYRNRVQ